jgi:amphi-Trp domain-containing protein
MSKKVKLFESESSFSRNEAAALFRRIGEHLALDGTIHLEHDAEELSIVTSEPITIEIEATHKNDSTKLEIEMTWTGGAPALEPPS